MLTSKQRSYLRGMANTIDSIFQIGKGNINDNLIKQIEDALEAREIIKIHVLNNSETTAKEACKKVTEITKAEPVQVIGNKFVIYKPSKENKRIKLP